ncbi:TolC family protein [Pedobacter sp. BS3]|nr:TolC family protein [Pedobacter sp. BS3]
MCCSGLYAQEKITIQQAVDIALKNNLQVKQIALNESLSDVNVKQSKLALYPTLNANSSLNFNFGRNVDPTTYQFVNQAITTAAGGLSSDVTLFQGLQKMNQISQNKYQLEADKSSTKKAKNDLVLNVVTVYLQILNNRDLLRAAQQQLDLSRQQLDRTQKLFDVGNNTQADLSQAKAQVASAELNVTNTQNQFDIAMLDLSQLMERNPDDKFEIVDPVIDVIGQLNTGYAASQIYNESVDNYPDVKVAQYNRLVAAKGVDIAKGGLYPRLTLGANLRSQYSNKAMSPLGLDKYPFNDQIRDNFYQSVGFNLDIPIFNGWYSRLNVRKAKISLQNAEIAEQLAKNNYNKVINQAVLDLRAAEKKYYSTVSAYQSTKEAFNVIEKRYNVGLVNSLDFNQSQTDLNTAEFNMIQAKYDLIFRSKVIDFYLGKPITF